MKAKWVAMVVLAMAMAMSVKAQDQQCVNKLVPCANYLNGTTPSKECCDSIKEAVAKELPCLCNLYNSPGLLQNLGVSVAQALNLTTSCGVPIRLDQCNASAPSPQAQTPPGGGSGGAERAALAGICTIFLLFVSTLFY